MHRFDPQNMKKLDREERKAIFKAGEIWKEIGLKTGMAAVDIGCGTGFFTFDAASITGGAGIVYGLDIQKPMIEELKKRIEVKGVTNIKPVLTKEDSLVLPQNTADIAFMAFVLHEVDEKPAFIKETYRIIKPGGTVCILEWKKTQTLNGPPSDHRISEYEVLAWLESAGFTELVIHAYNPDTVLIIGKK